MYCAHHPAERPLAYTRRSVSTPCSPPRRSGMPTMHAARSLASLASTYLAKATTTRSHARSTSRALRASRTLSSPPSVLCPNSTSTAPQSGNVRDTAPSGSVRRSLVFPVPSTSWYAFSFQLTPPFADIHAAEPHGGSFAPVPAHCLSSTRSGQCYRLHERHVCSQRVAGRPDADVPRSHDQRDTGVQLDAGHCHLASDSCL